MQLPLEVQGEGGQKVIPHSLENLRVLLLDENATSREYLERTLQGWGWRLDTVASVASASRRVSEAEESGDPYEVLLMDWLPDTQQRQTLVSEIRERPGHADLIVVALIAPHDHDPEDDSEPPAGVNAVLVKPVTSSRLFDKLHEVMHEVTGGSYVTDTKQRPMTMDRTARTGTHTPSSQIR